MEDRKELKRAIAVPVFNTVLLPGVTTVIRLGEHDNLLLKNWQVRKSPSLCRLNSLWATRN